MDRKLSIVRWKQSQMPRIIEWLTREAASAKSPPPRPANSVWGLT